MTARNATEAALDATVRPFDIRDAETGEVVGQAPGNNASTALHVFNRDALDGNGIGAVAGTGRYEIQFMGVTYYATPQGEDDDLDPNDHVTSGPDLENGPHPSDVPAPGSDLSGDDLRLELEQLQAILAVKTTDATRDLALARIAEVRKELLGADDRQLNQPASGGRISEAAHWYVMHRLDHEGLPGYDVEDEPTRRLTAAMWSHALMGAELEADLERDASRTSERHVADRVVNAWQALYDYKEGGQ